MVNQAFVYDVKLDDHTTLVRDSGGDGQPIILVHAMTLNNKFWQHSVFDAIAAPRDSQGRPRRTIAYDMRGHGRAVDAPITASCEQLANDLRLLCRTLQLEQVDVAGYSFGGVVAQQFTLDHPEIVRSALFIATLIQGVPAYLERATIAETKGMSPLIQPNMERWFFPKNLASNGPGVQYARKQLQGTKVEHWAAAWRALSKIDFEPRYQEINVPVLGLASKQDTSTPPAFMKKIGEMCKRGKYASAANMRRWMGECIYLHWKFQTRRLKRYFCF